MCGIALRGWLSRMTACTIYSAKMVQFWQINISTYCIETLHYWELYGKLAHTGYFLGLTMLFNVNTRCRAGLFGEYRKRCPCVGFHIERRRRPSVSIPDPFQGLRLRRICPFPRIRVQPFRVFCAFFFVPSHFPQ